VHPFVLVGGWPGSGKTTLARALAAELDLAYLGKDEVKEALMDALGAPASVGASQDLGRAAVTATLRAARSCPGAVIDSTWFDYTLPLVAALPGPCVEIRCVVALETARQRYAARVRDARHLDDERDPDELWGRSVEALGVGPVLEVRTDSSVDVKGLAARVRAAASVGPAVRVGSIVVNCADLASMTLFWSRVLGLTPDPVLPGAEFLVLRGDSVHLSLQVARTAVGARDQMHLDLYTDDVDAEVARVLALGATWVREHREPDDTFVTLRDPEGNEFCLCDVTA
jgi:predicted enzyme related to lactoylglutathione lyase